MSISMADTSNLRRGFFIYINIREVRDQIGVIEPEVIMHKGDNHNHNDEDTGSVHGGGGEGEASQDKVEKMIESGTARAQAEVEELNILRPNIRVNVHDPRARSAVDSLKMQQQKKEIGPTFERAVHGHDHVHDHEKESDHTSRKVIKYKDIVDLELGEQMLKGIDLSRLLEQERREAAEWRQLSGYGDEDDVSISMKHTACAGLKWHGL
ncbi:hypothetical protein ElyMa_003990900 [Elysia marginata]|uniref:Uncharacterized protein n=1 Tax=Elysia marginata TaxID=1093978 RepID=A0AAV4FY76_9GAST|nr:hypothetical protein ElyMa_003990900 [Elysia marginata]